MEWTSPPADASARALRVRRARLRVKPSAGLSSPSPYSTTQSPQSALTTSARCPLHHEATPTSFSSPTASAAVPTRTRWQQASSSPPAPPTSSPTSAYHFGDAPSRSFPTTAYTLPSNTHTPSTNALASTKSTPARTTPALVNGGVERVNLTMALMLAMGCNEK